jgi:hypothetical protein
MQTISTPDVVFFLTEEKKVYQNMSSKVIVD